MTTTAKPKQCPFCGSESSVECFGGHFYVRCSDCLTFHNVASSNAADAIAKWNKRAPSAAESILREIAEDGCAYGDNCPPFVRTNHGDCLPCKARRALEASP